MRGGEVQALSALLMAAIVISAFSLLWIWLYPRYLDLERMISEGALEAEAFMSERVVVERVKEVEGGLKVYITNTGRVYLELVSVYVNDTLGWEGRVGLGVGEGVDLEVSAPHGEVYRVRVCSARGNCWDFLERGWP